MIKVFETVAFNGRNGNRPIDKTRIEAARHLMKYGFNFYSITSPTKPNNFSMKPRKMRLTTIDRFLWGLTILDAGILTVPDIIHSFPDILTYELCKFIAKKRVSTTHLLTFHGAAFPGYQWDNRKIPRTEYEKKGFLLGKKNTQLADCVSAVSKNSISDVKKSYGVDAIYQPEAIDAQPFVTKKNFLQHKRPRFVYVGSLERRKQPDIIPVIAKRNPQIDFYLLGNGSLRNYIEEACQRLPNLFYLKKPVPNNLINNFFLKFDVFLFPSIWEGLANVVLEAMSSGLPVFAADATSNPEMVFEGKNGYLFNGLEAVQQKIDYFLDENALKKMGKESRRIIDTTYDWQVAKIHHLKAFMRAMESK